MTWPKVFLTLCIIGCSIGGVWAAAELIFVPFQFNVAVTDEVTATLLGESAVTSQPNGVRTPENIVFNATDNTGQWINATVANGGATQDANNSILSLDNTGTTEVDISLSLDSTIPSCMTIHYNTSWCHTPPSCTSSLNTTAVQIKYSIAPDAPTTDLWLYGNFSGCSANDATSVNLTMKVINNTRKELINSTLVLNTESSESNQSVEAVSPADEATVNESTPTFTYNVTNTNTDTTVNATVYVDNGSQWAVAFHSIATPVSDLQVTNESNTSLPDNEYQWWVSLTNGTWSTMTTRRNLTVSATVPDITYTEPTPVNTANLSHRHIPVNVTIVDNDLSNLTFRVFNTTILYNNTTLTNVDGGKSHSMNFTNQTDGVYTFNVTAYDRAGLRNTTSTRSVTIDTNTPDISYVPPTVNNTTTRAQSYIFVNVTLSNTPTTTSLANATFLLANTTDIIERVQRTTNLSNSASVNFTNLSDNTYQFNVSIADTAGNINVTPRRETTVDTTAPLLNNVNDTTAEGFIAPNTSFSVNASIVDAVTTVDTVRIGNSTQQTMKKDNGIYTIHTNFSALGCAGNYSCRAHITVNDTAGNVDTVHTLRPRIDNHTPQWRQAVSEPSSVSQGDIVTHASYWNDSGREQNGSGIHSYIFSWNGSTVDCGTWTNVSNALSDTHVARWVNITASTQCTGTIGWKIYVTDGVGHQNNTPIRTYSVTKATDDGGTTGGGGGNSDDSGGDGSTQAPPPIIVANNTTGTFAKVITHQKAITARLTPGSQLHQPLTVENVGTEAHQVHIQTVGIPGTITVRPEVFALQPNATRTVTVNTTIPGSYTTGTEITGKLDISYANNGITVPVAIEVTEEPQPLLDVILSDATIEDDTISYDVRLSNLGKTGRIDVKLLSQLKDTNGSVITRRQGTYAINTSASFHRKLSVPSEHQGKLTLEVIAQYPVDSNDTFTAEAGKTLQSDSVIGTTPSLTIGKITPMLVIIISVVLLGLGGVILVSYTVSAHASITGEADYMIQRGERRLRYLERSGRSWHCRYLLLKMRLAALIRNKKAVKQYYRQLNRVITQENMRRI